MGLHLYMGFTSSPPNAPHNAHTITPTHTHTIVGQFCDSGSGLVLHLIWPAWQDQRLRDAQRLTPGRSAANLLNSAPLQPKPSVRKCTHNTTHTDMHTHIDMYTHTAREYCRKAGGVEFRIWFPCQCINQAGHLYWSQERSKRNCVGTEEISRHHFEST